MTDLQPTLENRSILVRPLLESDFEGLYDVAQDSLIWEQHPCPNRYQKHEFENFFEESINSGGALIIIDKSNNEYMGSSRYKILDQLESAVEIGWTFLARKYWGGKYNSMVKSLMIDHALNHFDEVIFYVTESNIRSQKALKKIGAEPALEKKYISSTPINDLTFRISKHNWTT